VLPASPVRPASPHRPAGPGRPGRTIRTGGPSRQSVRDQRSDDLTTGGPTGEPSARNAEQIRRTPFVMLVLGLLGGGLVCLLVVNTTLAANSIEITNLQQANTAKTQLVQQLRQQVAAQRSAAVIEKEAKKLGMLPDPVLNFLDLRTGTIKAG
jgi:hypothetical protein